MSEETLNPDLNKVTPSTNEGVETPRPAILAGVSEEHLGMVLSILGDVTEAITDVPAQIELLSRVTLAKSFIQYDQSSKEYRFNAEKFNKVWDILSTENEQNGG